jgi:hypothetical protein
MGREVMYYRFRDKILSTIVHPGIENIRKKYYFMRLGEVVARIDGGYILTSTAGRNLDITLPRTDIDDEVTLDAYLR